jgi:8-oxo-dGTP pyrophosphatase MutT (NUDIX family)
VSQHERFVVVPASYVFLLRGEGESTEVLLQLRQGVDYMDGHWAAGAAGHVERGETAVGDLTFLTAMQRTRGGEPIDERIDFFFTARSWTGEPRVTEPDKSGGLRWTTLDRLPDPVVPHERVVLDALRTGSITAYSTHGFTDAPVQEGAPT